MSHKISKTTAEQFTLDGDVSEKQTELAERSKQQLVLDTVRNNERDLCQVASERMNKS